MPEPRFVHQEFFVGERQGSAIRKYPTDKDGGSMIYLTEDGAKSALGRIKGKAPNAKVYRIVYEEL